jgi:hypothetical protein
MTPFVFSYENNPRTSTYEHFREEGYHRFRILLENGDSVIIAPSGIRDTMNNIIWVQSIKPGESNQTHEFIQALGKGLENSGLQF